MNEYNPFKSDYETKVTGDFLDTLERLNLYKPEIPWEDIIMRSMKNFGQPTHLLVNPKVMRDLMNGKSK
jgi:hypothetical protein